MLVLPMLRLRTRFRSVVTISMGLLCSSLPGVDLISPAALGDEPSSSAAAPAANAGPVLATVNDHPIRQSELDFLYLVRRIPEADRDALQAKLLQDLIDQRLMREFLASRRTEAPPAEVTARITALRQLIERSGRNSDEVLQSLGVTEETIRQTLALPLAWNVHARRTITDEQIADWFARHRARFDGSRLRLSQIVRTVPAQSPEADRQAAIDLLTSLRNEITVGTTTFSEAAAKQSQSPSGSQGGDVGWITYGGSLPRELVNAAFALKSGEISEPVVTRFGVHLVTVTDVRPGDLSLEDVRDDVLAELSQQLWHEQLATERSTARIKLPADDR